MNEYEKAFKYCLECFDNRYKSLEVIVEMTSELTEKAVNDEKCKLAEQMELISKFSEEVGKLKMLQDVRCFMLTTLEHMKGDENAGNR